MAEEQNQGTAPAQTQLETFDSTLTVPAHKLDADQYSADDIDGGTEGLFGSGNMAYASLQASQTDAVLTSVDPFQNTENVDFQPADNNPSISAPAPDAIDNNTISTANPGGNAANEPIITDTDRGIATQDQFNAPSGNSNNGNFTSSTVGSVSASELSSNQGSFAPAGSGLSLQEGLNGTNGQDGQTPDIPDIQTPTDGTDGADGTDGTGGDGGGDTTINLGDVNIDLGDVIEFLDETFIDLGDTINNLTTSVTEITELLGDVITNLDISNLLDLTQITNLVNDLTINLSETVNTTLINVTNITNNVTNLVENLLGVDGDLELNLDLNLLDTAMLDVNVPLGDLLATDINLDIDLNPAVDLVNNVADLTGLDVLSDSLAELGGTIAALQNTIDQVTDLVTDLDLSDTGATVDQLVETLENLDTTVAEITGSVDEAVGGLLDTVGIGEGDGTLGDTVDGVLDDIGDTLGDLTGGATDDLTDGLEEVVDQVTDAVDALTDDTLDEVGETVEQAVDTVTDIVDDTVSGLEDVLTGEGDIGDVVQDVVDNAGDLTEDVLEGASDAVDELVSDLGDTLDTLTGGASDDLTDGLEEAVSGITDGLGGLGGALGGGDEDATLGDSVDDVAESVTDVIDGLSGGATSDLTDGVEEAVDQVTDIIDQITDPLLGGGEESPLEDLAGGIADALGLGEGDGGDGGEEEGLISQTLDPVIDDVTDVVDGLTGGAASELTDGVDTIVDGITDFADNLFGGLTGGFLGQNNDNNNGADTDADINLGLGEDNNDALNDLTELALDPVEDLAGDIDLGVDAGLLGDGETNNNEGDSDLTIDTGIDLVDNTLLEEGLDVPLDPLEEITGDIDLDIDLAADLLGQQADPLVDEADGGTGEDTVLAGLGDGLSDLVGGALSGDSQSIQNGSSQIAEASESAIDEAAQGVESTLEELNALANDLGIDIGDDSGDQDGLISQTLDPVIDDVTDAVDDLTGGTAGELTEGADQVVDQVTDLADNLLGGLTDDLLGEQNNNAEGDDSDLTADAGIDLINHDIVDAVLDVAIDPVEDLAGDLDVDLGAATNLLNNQNTDNESGDSDVTAQADAELVDTELLGGTGEVHLDPVEQLAGDLDIDVTAVTDILGNTADDILNDAAGGTGEDTLLSHIGDGLNEAADALVPGLNAGDDAQEDLSLETNIDIIDENLADADLGSVLDPAEEIAGDIDAAIGLDTDLLNNQNTDNANGDSDISGGLDIDLGGHDIADIPLEIPLDLIEQATGDVDLNIDGALDLLNADNSENGDDAAGGEETSWTESIITDSGGLFGDIVGGTDGLGDALPDPSGTVAEGIGALDVDPELDIGSIGGLFG